MEKTNENNNENLNNEQSGENSNEKVSEKVERQELEKKYYSQKKEIKKKLNDAHKALDENVKEVEEDYKKVLEEEPGLLSEDDKKGFEKYVADQKEKIKTEIQTLQAHENELELDYEDLKTEPKVDMLIQYEKIINHAVGINAPLMKMVFDYFNFLNDKKENQDKAQIKIDCFLDDKGLFSESFPHNTNMEYYYGSVMVDFKNRVRVIVTLKKYYEQGKGFVHKLCFFSEGKTYLNPDYLGKKILFNAIAHSKIKGTYITLAAGSIMWHQENLEKRAFSDIFLPKSIMEDLKLYTTLYDKTGKLLRYLMIGNPGTGKTESTLAIANYLKDQKVTVIKTMVCEALKEKIELAELLAPAIVIFDDIDLSLGSRKKGGVSSGLAQFLDVLDGTEKIRKDVGIIATTNSLELLDMAAQRPGRFDKLLSFDSLTKSNIRNIILKSLRYNFDLQEDSEEVKPFIQTNVVEKFFASRVTGSHVYNTTKMLYLRIKTLELENITPEWVVNEISLELTTLARIRRTDYLNDKMTGGTNNDIGFPLMKNDSAEDDEEYEQSSEEETKVDSPESCENSTFDAKEDRGEYRPSRREGDIPKVNTSSEMEQSNLTKDSGQTEQSI